MRSRALRFARDFLALSVGVDALLWPIAIWGLDLDAGSPWAFGLVTVAAAFLALLGLFLTWGDGGSAVDTAVKGAFVALLLVAVLVVFLLWARQTAGEGT